MESLVRSVLLGVSGLDAQRADPEPDPPDAHVQTRLKITNEPDAFLHG